MDRVIVVTGASGGIGEAFAVRAGKAEAKLVLAARRKDELERVAKASGEALVVPTDVTDRAQVDGLMARALERFGRVDVWVNNAGRGITRSVGELTDADMDEMWRTNVKSAVYGMQAVLPHFKTRGTGQILNVSSMLGRMPLHAPMRSAYSACKSALNTLSTCLRMELAATHPEIAVTVVMPGIVGTDFGNNALNGGADSRALPGAQPVEEVAEVMLDAVEHPRPEVYSRPEMQEGVERYYHDVAGVEAAALRFMANARGGARP